ncbi:hypothetical protein COV16_01840 [Candidatus Woesearchaeota archaeon CG10_big_fil_rev_8_21_14_0_10_34_8]|nr:MAG: hypothetical protein COV16_01840 [Candidatus Woesearchaeota archaeon CG10_big_fil_rev_8_21_14_0_10_34_8]
MKKAILMIMLLLTFILAGCTANFFQAQVDLAEATDEDGEDSDVDFNFCTLESDYLYCKAFELTSNTLNFVIEVTSSDVESVDSVVFELPDSGVYCTADTGNGFLTTDDYEDYTAAFTVGDDSLEEDCVFDEYAGQDVQMAFQVTLTLTDGSTVTEEGDVTDTIENSE